jgi:hypothetical protein
MRGPAAGLKPVNVYAIGCTVGAAAYILTPHGIVIVEYLSALFKSRSTRSSLQAIRDHIAILALCINILGGELISVH